jgi:tetratricopeptide (TPR) repeat protein
MRTVFSLFLSVVATLFVGCNPDHERTRTQGESTPKQDAAIIFRAPDGRTLTMADLEGLTGTFNYEILGSSNVPAEADSLHKQARHAGESGDYKKAITLLERATSLAPAWPYPVYDMAYTYLLLHDADKARRYYRKTIELSPRGFFTAITALDALDREAKGDLPVGTYLAYLSLEWMEDAGKKKNTVRQLVERVPNFAPAWKELATQTESDTDKLAAIEKGLAANPDSETKGILLINKALVLDRRGDHDGAVRLLGELALDPASPYDTEHLAKITLADIARK